VIKGDAADVVIEFGAQSISVHDASRQASLAAWQGTPVGAWRNGRVFATESSGRLRFLRITRLGSVLSYTTFEVMRSRSFRRVRVTANRSGGGEGP